MNLFENFSQKELSTLYMALIIYQTNINEETSKLSKKIVKREEKRIRKFQKHIVELLDKNL